MDGEWLTGSSGGRMIAPAASCYAGRMFSFCLTSSSWRQNHAAPKPKTLTPAARTQTRQAYVCVCLSLKSLTNTCARVSANAPNRQPNGPEGGPLDWFPVCFRSRSRFVSLCCLELSFAVGSPMAARICTPLGGYAKIKFAQIRPMPLMSSLASSRAEHLICRRSQTAAEPAQWRA